MKRLLRHDLWSSRCLITKILYPYDLMSMTAVETRVLPRPFSPHMLSPESPDSSTMPPKLRSGNHAAPAWVPPVRFHSNISFWKPNNLDFCAVLMIRVPVTACLPYRHNRSASPHANPTQRPPQPGSSPPAAPRHQAPPALRPEPPNHKPHPRDADAPAPHRSSDRQSRPPGCPPGHRVPA